MKETDDLLNSIERNAALAFAPTDHSLMKQAEETMGHISLKAVSDEYNRLLLAKLYPPRRSLWARLFGG